MLGLILITHNFVDTDTRKTIPDTINCQDQDNFTVNTWTNVESLYDF